MRSRPRIIFSAIVLASLTAVRCLSGCSREWPYRHRVVFGQTRSLDAAWYRAEWDRALPRPSAKR